MKRYILFTLLLSGLTVQQTIPQTTGKHNIVSTEYSGFETLLQGSPVTPIMKVVLATYWDRLPSNTGQTTQRKEELAKAFEKKFKESPDDVDLKDITQFADYIKSAEAREARFQQEGSRLQRVFKGLKNDKQDLQNEIDKINEQIGGLITYLNQLSKAQDAVGRDLLQRDQALTGTVELTKEEMAALANKLQKDQQAYKLALNNLQDHAATLGHTIDLENRAINTIIQGALSEVEGLEEIVESETGSTIAAKTGGEAEQPGANVE